MGRSLMALGAALIALSFPVPGLPGACFAIGGIGFVWAGYFRLKDGC